MCQNTHMLDAVQRGGRRKEGPRGGGVGFWGIHYYDYWWLGGVLMLLMMAAAVCVAAINVTAAVGVLVRCCFFSSTHAVGVRVCVHLVHTHTRGCIS